MGWLGGDDFSGRNKLNERDGTMNMKRWTVMVAVMGAVATLSAVAVTHNILTSYQTAAGSLTGTASVTSDTEQNADVTMTSGGTNVVLAVPINVSNALSLALFSTTDCTVAMYNGTTATKTNTLLANTPTVAVGSNAIWLVCVSNTITSLKLSCSSNACTFSLRSVVHNGP